MISFKRFLAESFESPKLTQYSIYNFGYLAYLFLYSNPSRLQDQMINDELKSVKNRYLEDVSDLCVRQIKKYIDRGRIDKDSEGNPTFDFDKMNKMNKTSGDRMIAVDKAMNSSYRSDMRRRNKVWNLVTQHLVELSKARSNKDLVAAMDRLNNDIHNTRESIFVKFPNGDDLVTALDKIHESRTPTEYKRKVSSNVLEIEKL